MNLRIPTLLPALVGVVALSLLTAGCPEDAGTDPTSDGSVISDTSTDQGGTSDAGAQDTGGQDGTPTPDGGPQPDAVGDSGPEDGTTNPDGVTTPDGTTSDVVEPDAVVQPDVPTGYPSEDLMVKIVSPGDGNTADALGPFIRVDGLLFGDADTLSWQASNGTSGTIEENTFWGAAPIELSPGDNVITVSATRGADTVSDSIVVTYNPGFRFDSRLVARPNQLWVGGAKAVIFNVASGIYANFDPSSVELLQVDAQGNLIQSLGSMVDNGNVGINGDEIQGDGVFSSKEQITCSSTDPMYFRASVQVTAGNQTYKAFTPTHTLWCAEHYQVSQCQADQQVIADAETQLNGGTDPDAVVANLLNNSAVKAAGRSAGDGLSLWIQFNSGVLGAVLGTPVGMRGAGDNPPSAGQPIAPSIGQNIHEIGSRTGIVLAPFYGEFAGTDDGPQVASILSTSECPNFELEGGGALQGPQANLAMFRDSVKYGITSISTHGEALFGGMDPADMAGAYHWDHLGEQEVIWSGEQVNCTALQQTDQNCTVSSSNPTGGCPTGTICIVTEGSGGSTSSGTCVDRTQFDLRLGRVAMTNQGYAMTPKFFETYASDRYPDSLVNLGACRTMYNGTLAGTLMSMGAKAVTGFSGFVSSAWAKEKVVEMFEGAVGVGQIGSFHVTEQDPENPGAWWRLLGASNLDLSRAEIINPSFERGDTTGWRRDGDGRVVSQLGTTASVHGKFMGLISTGLGFTVQTGTLEQDFCIPEDKTTVSVYWKFFSEEFKEFCGSQYQDTFQAVLSSNAGQFTVVDLKIDDLCGYGDGSCSACTNPIACDVNCMGTGFCTEPEGGGQCQGTYPCECGRYFVGLIPADVQFDVGGVFNVLWQKTTKVFPAQLAAGGKVTMRLYASDTGDSIYDTVILVDDIKFE